MLIRVTLMSYRHLLSKKRVLVVTIKIIGVLMI